MLERAVPVLPGDDLALAKAFYVDKLGFRVRYEATEDGTSGIMGIERGTIELTIDCPMSGHGRHVCASLVVNSTDAYYEEWRDKVEMERPPMNEPWGGRTSTASPVEQGRGERAWNSGPASTASGNFSTAYRSRGPIA